MTQRIFDVGNEQDMQELWNILPDWAQKIKKNKSDHQYSGIFAQNEAIAIDSCIFKINWHDKTEIIRPIPEATEKDIGKLCVFWNEENGMMEYNILKAIMPKSVYKGGNPPYFYAGHCRRLTKQEIKELC